MTAVTVPTDLGPREAAAQLVTAHDPAWLAQFTDELDRRLHTGGLERVMRRWSLSRAELGALFGVSRQAVSKWLTNGVPGDRVEQVATVAAITDLLERYVQADRIPAVVRRRAPGLGDRSLFELVSQGRSNEALERTRQMFTFTEVHA